VGAGFVYWAVGWGFAYGDVEGYGPCKFIGVKNFFSTLIDDTETYPAEWFFQMVFAATASTIVNGAVAERVSFCAYLTYSLFITGFVYPVVSHWGWSSTGWLANPPESAGMPPGVGMKDFAGSGIVHCTGGIAALVAATLMGPRIGRFDEENGKTKSFLIPGHSVPFTVLGGFILFLGFLAFNGGKLSKIKKFLEFFLGLILTVTVRFYQKLMNIIISVRDRIF
jgi:Amt family ammonium transporter